MKILRTKQNFRAIRKIWTADNLRMMKLSKTKRRMGTTNTKKILRSARCTLLTIWTPSWTKSSKGAAYRMPLQLSYNENIRIMFDHGLFLVLLDSRSHMALRSRTRPVVYHVFQNVGNQKESWQTVPCIKSLLPQLQLFFLPHNSTATVLLHITQTN